MAGRGGGDGAVLRVAPLAAEDLALVLDRTLAGQAADHAARARIGVRRGEEALEVRPDFAPYPAAAEREARGCVHQVVIGGVAIGQVAQHPAVGADRRASPVADLRGGGGADDEQRCAEQARGGMADRMHPDRVLFLDGEALVIDKPAGLPVDPPRDGSLSLENHLDGLTFGFQRWPQAVHRLDRDTSGCLLLSRNPKAHARFGRIWEAGGVEKRYLAALDGVPPGEDGLVDLPLAKRSTAERGWRMVADPEGKPSRTRWRLLEARGGWALVEFRPETGRTHQIRVHAAAGLGAAVLGDPVYGRAHPKGMMLHAAGLRVPREGKPPVEAEAPTPERFAAIGFG